MPSESPFREDDLQARVEALRAERDQLAQALEIAVKAGARRGPWSWWRFLMGMALLPAAVTMSIALLALFS
jgi:hypothetical protein